MTPEDTPLSNNSGDEAPDFGAVTPPASVKDEKPKEEKPKGELPKQRRRVRPPTLEKQLQDTFAGIAVAIGATGDMYCATHVAQQAEPLAKAWADLAKTNPAVEQILIRMMSGSAWGAVIFTTAATVIPIAAHHGLYPKRMPMPYEFGLGPPPPPSEEVAEEEKKGDK